MPKPTSALSVLRRVRSFYLKERQQTPLCGCMRALQMLKIKIMLWQGLDLRSELAAFATTFCEQAERFNMNTIHMAHSSDLQEIGLTAGEISRYKQELKVSCQLHRSRYNHRGDAHIGEASHPGPWPFSGYKQRIFPASEIGGPGSGSGSGLVPHTAAAAEGEAPAGPQNSGSAAEFLSSSSDSDMPPLEDATRVRSFTRTQFISFCNARQEEMDLPPMGIHNNCESCWSCSTKGSLVVKVMLGFYRQIKQAIAINNWKELDAGKSACSGNFSLAQATSKHGGQ